ncbi:unnamed protein product [Clonostachys solani]|uniref:Uncharacterized protein n=1 Tax=Clonostachys solani TaxID=160281 RepID=A0A9N9W873_9HYPO|nr:unnamed protein product [Clonostachys solani]
MQEYSWVLQQSDTYLVRPFSRTANQLHEVFRPLKKMSALHIFFDKAAASLLIKIPRLQLDFYINKGSEDIISRQYRGMHVNPQQAIRTLIGLADKLVLVKVGDSQNRSVLIPDWQPNYSRSPHNNHVTVNLHYSTTRVQSYQLNHHLHCLTGNGSLKSKLFLAELHALTSGLIEDPFTLHTGTEEALTILRSAGVHSFSSLSEAEIEILKRIATLSPARTFYPKHLKVMQVDNQGLSPLLQHLDFSRIVRALFKQASKASFLYKDFIKPPTIDRQHQGLEDREAIRSASFYKAGFGAEWHTIAEDVPYNRTRDRDQNSQRAIRVSKVAAVFRESPVQLPFQISLDAAQKIYTKLGGLPIFNPNQAGLHNLSFNAKWVGTAWGGIQKAFETRNPDDHFLLFSWVVSVAFAKDIDESTLSVLLGLMFYPQYRLMAFPQNCCLNLEEGYQADLAWLRSSIESHYIEFDKSTMRTQVEPLRGESRRAALRRVESLFKSQQKEFASSLEKHVHRLWPRAISDPANAAVGKTYLKVPKAMHQIRARCKSWHNNLLFLQSLEQVCFNMRCITLSPTIFGTIDQTLPLPAARDVHRHIRINHLFASTNALGISSRDFSVQLPNVVIKTESANEACLVSALGSRIASLAKLPQEGCYVEYLAESINQFGQNKQQFCLTVNGEELH